MWGGMGVIELISLIQKAITMKNIHRSEQIGREEYHRKINSLKVCFLVNVSYLVFVSVQLWYVIRHWDQLNI